MDIRLSDSSSSSGAQGALGAELATDMAAAIEDYGHEFIWEGIIYPCVTEFTQSRIVVARTLFADGVLPSFGDQITIAGEIYQVKSVNGSEGFLSGGGIVEDRPLVNDANDPAIIIGFGKFITK